MMHITQSGHKFNIDIPGQLTHQFGNGLLLVIAVATEVIGHDERVGLLIYSRYFDEVWATVLPAKQADNRRV